MVIKKDELKKEVVVEEEQKKNSTFVTQLITAMQNLGIRLSNLEIQGQATLANEKLTDKRLEFLAKRIDFIDKKLE